MCECCSSADGSRQRGGEAASEPRITLEIVGLCTENYLLANCPVQSPGEGCGVVPAPSGRGPCPVPHPGWAAEVAAHPVKHQERVWKFPELLPCLGHLAKPSGRYFVPAVSRKALRPRHTHNLCVPSSTLPPQGTAGCSHDIHSSQILTPDHPGCTAPTNLPGLSAACEVGRKQQLPLSAFKAVTCSILTRATPALS